jgi:hypothetical protein
MDKLALKKFVEDNPKLVSMRPAGDGIYVLKYKRTVFYDNLWNDYLEECRGTIVDADFNIVSRPFTKIYNYGIEAKAPRLDKDTQVTAFRKVNGFMCAMTWHNDALLISTTGSTDSPHVKMVEELVASRRDAFETHCEFYKDFTWMFECVHRDDPHIVPEKEGLYLLAWRKKEWDSQVECDPFALGTHAQVLGTHHVESVTTNMERLEEIARECRHEGYVFYAEDGASAKIKSPYYLTSKWVARNPRTDKLVNLQNDIKQHLDEEYYPLVDAIRANIVEYTALDEQARLAWVREQLT